MAIPLFSKLVSAFGGAYADAAFVAFDNTVQGFETLPDDVQAAIQNLLTQIRAVPSGGGSQQTRAFIRDNSDIVIGLTDPITTHHDINTIYAAGIDKNVVWRLPTEAQIASSPVDYPVVFEFTHLGGTVRDVNDFSSNRVEVTFQLGDTQRIDVTSGAQDAERLFMFQGDIVIISKASAGADWQAQYFAHTTAGSLLPSGVFELQTDNQIQNITNLATELSGVTIQAGDAFEVVTGGEYFGANVNARDVIVALVGSPELTTNSEDWLVLSNSSNELTTDEIAFFNNIARSGTRFDLSRNVFVNESNVIAFSSAASNTPASIGYFDSNGDGGQRNRLILNENLQFSDLQGGTLTLAISFTSARFSGFLPDLQAITLDYGSGISFTFPLIGVDASNGQAIVDIQIPNVDYSAALNKSCNINLQYVYRGASFIGTYTIQSVVNTLNGTLRQSITDIAEIAAAMAEQRVNTRINGLESELDQESSQLSALGNRISPLKTVIQQTPDVNALFLDSTGSDGFPADLSTMTPVSNDNPRFTVTGSAVFVAVISGANYLLNDDTGTLVVPLDNSQATVELGESRTFNGQTYFVYRVTGLTANQVIEVERIGTVQVVAWPDDIKNLQNDVTRIFSELDHAALNLSDAVIDVLDNSTTVTEESTATVNPSVYNQGLGNGGTQKIFYETTPKTASGGNLDSAPISETRNKLLYIHETHAYLDGNLVTATDGTTTTPLVSFANGVLNAKVFVPAIPAGSRTDTVYPAPSNRVSGAGIWQTIETLTFQNSIPVPEADELFFTRNIPSTSTTLNIAYRGHANGNIFGSNSASLADVGGGSNVSTTFTITDGSEVATVEVLYIAASRQIRVSVTERVNAGLPTINDIQVILSYERTVNVPATPATIRDVAIERQATVGDYNIIAFKPSSSGNLIIVGDIIEIDTGYSYTVLFGASETGNLTVASEQAEFLNFVSIDPTNTLVNDLENHASLTQYGLFTTTYSTNAVLELAVKVKVQALQIGNYELTIDQTDGTLITTELS